jgi:nitrogen regulatory protein PII 1
MLMIRAMVRPEKANDVLAGLLEAGYPAVTRIPVYGRGKQRGITAGGVTYDELPKELLLTVIKDKDKEFVVTTIMEYARSGNEGAFGDGKIFISPVIEAYTISSGVKETSAEE